MSTPVRTDYELALQAWVAAAITAGGGSYKAHFAPRSAGRDAADSCVMLQAVRRETRGTPFQAATTESYEGGPGCLGGMATPYRIRADINCYGLQAEALAEAIEQARWRPGVIADPNLRLKIETLSDWQDLTALEGPGYRTRWQAELTFQWWSVVNYEAGPLIETVAIEPDFLT